MTFRVQHLGHLLFVGMVTIGLANCGTWLGNPSETEKPDNGDKKTQMTIGFGASKSSKREVPIKNEDGTVAGKVEFTTFFVAISDAKFYDQEELIGTLQGPFVLDLITNTITPDPPFLDVSHSGFTRIELVVKELEKGQIPSFDDTELVGSSIYVVGAGKIAGQEIKLDNPLQGDQPLNVKTNCENGIKFNPSNLNTVLVDINEDDWEGFKISDILDTGSAEAVAKDISYKNVENHFRFGLDTDADGDLSDTESCVE